LICAGASTTTVWTALPMRRAASSEPEMSSSRIFFGSARFEMSNTRTFVAVPSPEGTHS
jgi:hypothetical protein